MNQGIGVRTELKTNAQLDRMEMNMDFGQYVVVGFALLGFTVKRVSPIQFHVKLIHTLLLDLINVFLADQAAN